MTDEELNTFCQQVFDMTEEQLAQLWRLAYTLYAHRALRKHVPAIYPPSTLPDDIHFLMSQEGANRDNR